MDKIPVSHIAMMVLLTLTLLLTVARVVEIMGGHAPTEALTAAFSASVTATLAAAAIAIRQNGHA